VNIDELVKAGLDLARDPDWSDSFLRHASTCTSQYDASHRKIYAHILALHQWVLQATTALGTPRPSVWVSRDRFGITAIYPTKELAFADERTDEEIEEWTLPSEAARDALYARQEAVS
jgi:hypothetical protein